MCPTATSVLPQPELVLELRRPEAYPRPVAEVGHLQTHISLLFFAGERVYKVKKPVNFGFLDFSTLALRRKFCLEEVRLNRRLAPDVYRGVVPIVRGADGHLRIGAEDEGPALEYAVEMVRLPAHRMLARLYAEGEVDNEQTNALAEMLVRFHAAAPTGPDVDEFGAPEAVARNVEENFAQLEPHVDGGGGAVTVVSAASLARLAREQRRFLAEQRPLLLRRVAEGRIREGHGDLHAGNICFPEGGPVAYDCIEFNRRFRCADVACDLAFLAMDLDLRGFPAFSGWLARRYARLAGDEELERVLPFYKTYRAIVRGKVEALTAADPHLSPAARAEHARAARRHLHLAVGYTLPPALVVSSAEVEDARRLAVVRALRAANLHDFEARRSRHPSTPRARLDRETLALAPAAADAGERGLLGDVADALGHGRSVVVTWAGELAALLDAAARLEAPALVVVGDDEAAARAASSLAPELVPATVVDWRHVADEELACEAVLARLLG